MLIYRQIEEKDNIALAALIRNTFEEFVEEKEGSVYTDPLTDNQFSLFGNNSRAELWIAEDEGKIIGSCGIYPTQGLPSDCAELVKYYILREGRGKGIGKELLDRTIESAKRLGYSKIYLETNPEFTKAISIYEKLKFKKLDSPMGNTGHTVSTIWMIKSIV